MKKILYMIPVLLVMAITAQAQINFSYDKSGNRIKCQLIVEPVADSVHTTAAANEKKTIKNTVMENTAISVYPNPTSDQLMIDTRQEGAYTIVLYDMQGKLVRREKSITSQHNVDMSACQAGYYFLEINTGNQSAKWKVLKQ